MPCIALLPDTRSLYLSSASRNATPLNVQQVEIRPGWKDWAPRRRQTHHSREKLWGFGEMWDRRDVPRSLLSLNLPKTGERSVCPRFSKRSDDAERTGTWRLDVAYNFNH